MVIRQKFYPGIFISICFLVLSSVLPAEEPAETPESLIERETALLVQMSELDSSDPNNAAQLRKIGTELRDIQAKLGTAGNNSLKKIPDAGLLQKTAPSLSAPPLAEDEPEQLFSPFDGMDTASLRQMRADISSQLKYLNQTMAALGPQDEGLSNSLKEQREELAGRLKEIDNRLGTDTPETDTDETYALPPESEIPSTLIPSHSAPAETVQLESDPTDTEGTWYGSDNKYAKILNEVNELKKANEETQKQLNLILDELKTIETQLKLLSRQAVADK